MYLQNNHNMKNSITDANPNEILMVCGGVNNCICTDNVDYGPGHAAWIGETRSVQDCIRQCRDIIKTKFFCWYGKAYRTGN